PFPTAPTGGVRVVGPDRFQRITACHGRRRRTDRAHLPRLCGQTTRRTRAATAVTARGAVVVRNGLLAAGPLRRLHMAGGPRHGPGARLGHRPGPVVGGGTQRTIGPDRPAAAACSRPCRAARERTTGVRAAWRS